MAQQLINIGVTADDGTGDTIRGAGIKINDNFTELFARPSVESQLNVIQNNISTDASNADIVIKPSGTGGARFPGVLINDNNVQSLRTNDDLRLVPNGDGATVIDGLRFSGTSIKAIDSSTVNVNEGFNVDGSLQTDGITFDTTVTVNSTLDVTGATTFSDLSVTGDSALAGTVTVDNLIFNGNNLSTSSNADLVFEPGGTGVVNISDLTIDSSINFSESLTVDSTTVTADIGTETSDQKGNIIKTLRSDDDLVLSGSGSGSVTMSRVEVVQGTIDGTTIGATSPSTGAFTTVAVPSTGYAEIDGVIFIDNQTRSNRTNDDLELAGNGTGTVIINGIKLPVSDGSAGQVLQTDGSGNLGYFTSPLLFDVSDLSDGTATLTGDSTTQTIDSFSTSTYRSAKYHLQISDTTADRYTLMEANVTHDGSSAYISSFGAASNGDGDGSTIYDSLDLSADISGGNVRLRGTVNNTNSQVIKFVRRPIKV
jgi:hypothetical protein